MIKKINIDTVTIYDIRHCLKLCKATKYKKNLTKLYRIVTGKETPILCVQTESEISKCFSIITLILSNENVSSMKSYPYYIYKLVELFGTDSDKEVLKFIYLQSRKTLIESDKRWSGICKKINITFIPTV